MHNALDLCYCIHYVQTCLYRIVINIEVMNSCYKLYATLWTVTFRRFNLYWCWVLTCPDSVCSLLLSSCYFPQLKSSHPKNLVVFSLVLTASFHDDLSKPLLECHTVLNFAAAWDNGGYNSDMKEPNTLKYLSFWDIWFFHEALQLACTKKWVLVCWWW